MDSESQRLLFRPERRAEIGKRGMGFKSNLNFIVICASIAEYKKLFIRSHHPGVFREREEGVYD